MYVCLWRRENVINGGVKINVVNKNRIVNKSTDRLFVWNRILSFIIKLLGRVLWTNDTPSSNFHLPHAYIDAAFFFIGTHDRSLSRLHSTSDSLEDPAGSNPWLEMTCPFKESKYSNCCLKSTWMVDDKELRIIHCTLGPLKPWDWWTHWLVRPVDLWQGLLVINGWVSGLPYNIGAEF